MATNVKIRALLTPREVAVQLRLSEPSVYRLIREGRLPAVRLGGPGASLRIRREELDGIHPTHTTRGGGRVMPVYRREDRRGMRNAAPAASNITVGELRKILRVASDDATLDEALAELAKAERREAADLEHGARVAAYNEYIARRREREHEAVQGAFTAAKEAVIAARPISREDAYMVGKEAADTERLRFEVREPLLTFEEWLAEGEPEIHEIRSARNLKAKNTRT